MVPTMNPHEWDSTFDDEWTVVCIWCGRVFDHKIADETCDAR